MRIKVFVFVFLILASWSICLAHTPSEKDKKNYRSFVGMSYRKAFNDLQDVHMIAARENGIEPLVSRADTLDRADDLVRLPNELDVYKVDKLTHSVPFLVPKAAKLLSDIAVNFRDSLVSKRKPLYKIIVTSVTRTEDDLKCLLKTNWNASEESSHQFGTTFDIAWVRYDKVNLSDKRNLDDGQLKRILAQVLFDLKERERCYIKHEIKQSCFHITVR